MNQTKQINTELLTRFARWGQGHGGNPEGYIKLAEAIAAQSPVAGQRLKLALRNADIQRNADIHGQLSAAGFTRAEIAAILAIPPTGPYAWS